MAEEADEGLGSLPAVNGIFELNRNLEIQLMRVSDSDSISNYSNEVQLIGSLIEKKRYILCIHGFA